MPFEPYIPETYASRDDPAFDRVGDVVYHFHADEDDDLASKKRKREDIRTKATESNKAEASNQEMVLPLRPARVAPMSVTDESASEDEDLRVVTKRRAPSVESIAHGTDPDEEYEVVQDEDAGVFSDSESDAITLVDIPSALPIRTRESAATAADAEQSGSDSESEWTLV